MTEKPDPEKKNPENIKGPGGMNMRELHELVKQSHARDQADPRAAKQVPLGGARSKSPWGAPNALKQPQSRWQRLARYVWDKKPRG